MQQRNKFSSPSSAVQFKWITLSPKISSIVQRNKICCWIRRVYFHWISRGHSLSKRMKKHVMLWTLMKGKGDFSALMRTNELKECRWQRALWVNMTLLNSVTLHPLEEKKKEKVKANHLSQLSKGNVCVMCQLLMCPNESFLLLQRQEGPIQHLYSLRPSKQTNWLLALFAVGKERIFYSKLRNNHINCKFAF